MATFRSRLHYPWRKFFWYPLNSRVGGGSQLQYGRFEENVPIILPTQSFISFSDMNNFITQFRHLCFIVLLPQIAVLQMSVPI